MKKIILLTLFSVSHLAFANDETTFFSSSNKSSDIGLVDDPDPIPEAPISDYILPLMVLASAIGFYYSRSKILPKK
ncbi:hypothetical protein [Empedobacter tilapiae]|uniref:Signal peptidase n=1 Tax=Empedobacter tilapiae TaxID=2491114 RepID=A0A4Z1BER7_9FLAO|nr:hypothetical protein [Empedobacter tilapiae]TGN27294.1 hypothetical protein E4J94_08790 [Empedobacter tilapiae]